MTGKEATLILEVDLDCRQCQKKIWDILCRLQDEVHISGFAVDKASRKVTVSGVFDAESVSRKLQAGRVSRKLQTGKETTLILKVDLDCRQCEEKIREILCRLQDEVHISGFDVDKASGKVTVSGVFDAERVSRKLQAGRVSRKLQTGKETTLILKVDLDCRQCQKKIWDILCRLQDEGHISGFAVDKTSGKVTVSGVFDSERVLRMLQAERVIKNVEEKKKEPEKKEETKKEEKREVKKEEKREIKKAKKKDEEKKIEVKQEEKKEENKKEEKVEKKEVKKKDKKKDEEKKKEENTRRAATAGAGAPPATG